MPKKRHQAKYSKPQSTAPASLSSSAARTNFRNNSSQHEDPSQARGVNELLSELRRSGSSGSGSTQHQADATLRPSVPPAIRTILQLPETPPPRPRRAARFDAVTGSRLPPGPAPPRSWLARSPSVGSTSPTEAGAVRNFELRPLPGTKLPEQGSLIDIVLRHMVLNWEWQRDYGRYYVYELPTHLRASLFTYLATYLRNGVSIRDLKALLLPPAESLDEDDNEDRKAEAFALPPPSVMNNDFYRLDLSGSIGRSLKMRELSDLLFPPQKSGTIYDPQESWDAPDEVTAASIALPLLPNLTHLSLAVDPECSHSVSWRHLLSFASHLSSLTHLSLAYWPEPSLTPNARLATVVSPQGRSIPYGGTGPYSHSLDGDWSEAIMVLTRLSRCLYQLEHLDLTGCGSWTSALWSTAGHDAVDWVGSWGKMETLVMFPGYKLAEDAGIADTAKYWEVVDNARRVERHVRAKREGRRRWFTVETVKRET